MINSKMQYGNRGLPGGNIVMKSAMEFDATKLLIKLFAHR